MYTYTLRKAGPPLPSVDWPCWSDLDRFSHRFSEIWVPSVWLMAGRSVPGHYTTLREADAETMLPPNRLVVSALT